MKRNEMNKKAQSLGILLFTALMLSVWAGPASAHNSLMYPKNATVSVGETAEVAATISEPLGVADFPFYLNERISYTYGPLKMAAFKGDSAVDLDISYSYIKDGTEKKFTYEEAEKAYLDEKGKAPQDPSYTLMSRVFNCDVVSYKVPSAGTVSFAGVSSYGTDVVVKSFMKTFVNLTADGESTKARASHFGFDGIELRPVDDLASVKSGGKIRVEALMNGKPQSGVVIYSGYKDIPEASRISPILEYSEKPDPIFCAAVTDQSGVAELKLPEVPSGASELKDVYIFTDGHLTVEKVRYRATISFTLTK
ncbi:MAG: DUF4198 domain-containing protein [Synergistaceae bacterium]|jgi:uncharacterized GH25 family protein|nr:DUF4198 domain-containing protein [Synergistaceae bacterium]